MSRPLHRGISGLRISGNSRDLWESQKKYKPEKEDLERTRSSGHSYIAFKLPFSLLFSDNTTPSKYSVNENGFAYDTFNTGTARSRRKLAWLLLRFSLVLIIILALTGSFWWTISISSLSRGQIVHNYRRLQEQLVSDLWDIGELSLGSSRLKEMEFCSEESENYVPCFNVSENLALGSPDISESDRHCDQGSTQSCLVLPPVNYKIPLRWPTGRDVIWVSNVKITAQEVLSSGSLTKRMMMLDDEQISFRSASLMFDGVEDYSLQIAEMIGLRNESNFIQAGVRTILDIGCGYGSFGAHLFSKQILTMCIANYEASGSQVQLTLERGLPAMIGSFTSKQLPYPSLSFDMLHCSRCGIDWDQKDGIYLIEVDRVLKPGGYFVWTSPITNARNKENQKKWNLFRDFAESLCWEMLSQQDETVVWKKTSKRNCYSSRKSGSGPSLCSRGHDIECPYYRPLEACIGGTHSRRWIPVEERRTWPSRSHLNNNEIAIYGLHPEEVMEDADNWKAAATNYWSLLSPLIFSDHPKRPGEEDPSPPFNMLRNVLDMNAHLGGFNSALLEAGKSVWVMNVVPTNGPNHLPLILDRGFVGVLHDWSDFDARVTVNRHMLQSILSNMKVPLGGTFLGPGLCKIGFIIESFLDTHIDVNPPVIVLISHRCEAFPTYPRTYDLVHMQGLLSLETGQQRRCTSLDIFIEIDRLLRPEGWVIIRDTVPLIESARTLTTRFKWEARVIDIDSNSDERLLICQKPFLKKQKEESREQTTGNTVYPGGTNHRDFQSRKAYRGSCNYSSRGRDYARI